MRWSTAFFAVAMSYITWMYYDRALSHEEKRDLIEWMERAKAAPRPDPLGFRGMTWR